MQRWKGDEAGVGCRVTGVRPIRLSGVGCSGDGREARGSAKVQIATESLCKGGKVEGIRGLVEKGMRGRGRQEAVQKCKRAKVQRWKGGKVNAIRGRVEKWNGGRGYKGEARTPRSGVPTRGNGSIDI